MLDEQYRWPRDKLSKLNNVVCLQLSILDTTMASNHALGGLRFCKIWALHLVAQNVEPGNERIALGNPICSIVNEPKAPHWNTQNQSDTVTRPYLFWIEDQSTIPVSCLWWCCWICYFWFLSNTKHHCWHGLHPYNSEKTLSHGTNSFCACLIANISIWS